MIPILDGVLARGVDRRLGHLPANIRGAVVLYCSGYRLSEIGTMYGVSKQAVHKWIGRAMRELTKRPRIPLLFSDRRKSQSAS